MVIKLKRQYIIYICIGCMYTNYNTPILNVKKNIFDILKDKNLIAH